MPHKHVVVEILPYCKLMMIFFRANSTPAPKIQPSALFTINFTALYVKASVMCLLCHYIVYNDQLIMKLYLNVTFSVILQGF